MRIVAGQPPKKPATSPRSPPTSAVTSTVHTPMNSAIARPVQHARAEIAAELVGAEGVAGRAGRLEAGREVARQWIVRREPGRRERHRHRERGEEQTQHAEAVPPHPSRVGATEPGRGW